ncbi:MAG TPA: nickel pincer cofactor biosynthesis protein LarB [Spirochaetota bacterium]|nr:nickel pincer cofactor biosynthesis protein LarB [Spirochaetota bacterium]
MNEKILQLLESLQQGHTDSREVYQKLFADDEYLLGHTRLDMSRQQRIGIPEVVYGRSKSLKELKSIIRVYLTRKKDILVTKSSQDKIIALKKEFPELHYNLRAGMLWRRYQSEKKNITAKSDKYIMVLSAGTSDRPVFLEAVLTLKFMGIKVSSRRDCGVAGIHRLMKYLGDISQAVCVIVVAGMEGALASVVSGLSGVPVIGVPTSVGYGASFNGCSALLGMLNSCAPSVSVVNIDNGFGAAAFAAGIYRKVI